MKLPAFALAALALSSCKDASEIIATPLNSQYADVLSLKENLPDLPLITSGVKTIIVPEKPQPYDLYNLIDTIRYVRLETWSDCHIDRVDKLVCDAAQMFILDKKNHAVYRFSEDGKYLGRIGAYGYGAGEYQDVEDIALDTKARTITLLDTRGAALLVYDYEGRFVKSMPLYYYFYQIAYIGDKLAQYTYFGNNSRLAPVDRHQLVISTPEAQGALVPTLAGFPYPESLRDAFHWMSGRPLNAVAGEVFYHDIRSDTIWEVGKDACRARYCLAFPDKASWVWKGEIDTDEKMNAYFRTTPHFNGYYTFTKHHMQFSIMQEAKPVTNLLYDRRSGHVLFGDVSRPRGDLFEYMCCYHFNFSDGEYFYHVLRPADLFRLLAEYAKHPQLKKIQFPPKDRALVESLHEDDNPILVKMKLKAF
ncbi:MAG: 6-bladed beta-propeller [Alloprevotella sp.]|nr:6-bladed beta-propeller [Alloprevotella sp.]MBR1594997.1 6-bladed beta-propeller [Alloprevotella sp.]